MKFYTRQTLNQEVEEQREKRHPRNKAPTQR